MSVKYELNEKGTRPWGEWEVISIGDKHIVKKITVEPNQSLSLQLHNHRKEHWIITTGTATVTVNNKVTELQTGQSIDIPQKTKHRMENKTDKIIQFIEIQMGEILDENDIIRFEDKYNRSTEQYLQNKNR